MTCCAYCQSYPRFWIFHPGDTKLDPRKMTCGEHLVMGVDEVMFEISTAEVLVVENQPS